MRKALIVLVLVFILAAPSYAGAQNVETGESNARIRVRNLVNDIFQNKEDKTIEGVEGIEIMEGAVGVEDSSSGRVANERAVQGVKVESPALDLRQEKAVSGGVCCKIFGYGTEMKEVNVHYEWVPGAECVVPAAFVGGSREVVEDEYCADVMPANQETAAGAVERVREKVKTFLNTTILKSTTTSSGPGEFYPADEAGVSQDVRAKLEQKRIEVREKIQENRVEAEAVRAEVTERVQERKQEFEGRIQTIEDENKREIAKRVHERLFDIQKRSINHFNEVLEKLDTIVTNIATRAEKAEASGTDIESVKRAVSNAESKIEQARESVKNAFREEYSIEGSGVEALRAEFQAARNELKNDLENARNTVRNAHEATRSAAEELTQAIGSE